MEWLFLGSISGAYCSVRLHSQGRPVHPVAAADFLRVRYGGTRWFHEVVVGLHRRLLYCGGMKLFGAGGIESGKIPWCARIGGRGLIWYPRAPFF